MSGTPGLVRSAPVIIVAVLLAGCTGKPPVEAYQHPVEQFVYGPDGYCLPKDCQSASYRTPASISAAPVNVPGGWIYSREKGGYYAPPRPAPAPPSYTSPSRVQAPEYAAPEPPPRSSFRDVTPPVETQTTPEPYRPEPAAFNPPPLIDIEKSPPATGASPDDACVGAWRICHFF